MFSSFQFQSELGYFTEYYKFHIEIPRLFNKPHNDVMNKYYDGRRRVEYYRIKRILKQ